MLLFSLVQPLMWMAFFGFLFHRYEVDDAGYLPYRDFLLPGVCVMTVLFGASQSGAGLVRDMHTGFLGRMLDTPAPPEFLLAGKLFADLVRLLGQGLAVGLLGVALGASLHPDAAALALNLAWLAAFALAYASLSCLVALRFRSQEALSAFIHLLNMPLLFTSTALVPYRHLPDCLKALAAWNPLSAAADGLRVGLGQGGAAPTGRGQLVIAVLATGLPILAGVSLARLSRQSGREA